MRKFVCMNERYLTLGMRRRMRFLLLSTLVLFCHSSMCNETFDGGKYNSLCTAKTNALPNSHIENVTADTRTKVLDEIINVIIDGSDEIGNKVNWSDYKSQYGFVGAFMIVIFIGIKRYRNIIKYLVNFWNYFLGYRKKRDATMVAKENVGIGNLTHNGSGTLNLNQTFIVNESTKQDNSQSLTDANMKPTVSNDTYGNKGGVNRGHSNINKFRPFSNMGFFRGGLFIKPEIRIKKLLLTVGSIHATCPKNQIPICIVDDKDGKNCQEGLKGLGYNNVEFYEKCPSFEGFRPFEIVIFDKKGVGNAAGKSGFMLAQELKREYPYKKVIVRSGYLMDKEKQDNGNLDYILEKDRDLCTQLGSVLENLSRDAGNPIALWQIIRKKKIETISTIELALLEHQYVYAVNFITNGSNVLPGNWMITVSRRSKIS